MEKLSLVLPPGFRFSPKDQELIEVYLKPKITGNDKDIYFVPEIEFYEHEPWDLQDKSGIDSKDQEWFFFHTPSVKYQNGNKKNRATKEGFWKATGNDREIKSRGSLIGMKKTLVYHRGRTPNGEGTKWVMHEYRTTQEEFDGTNPGQKAFVLCRLFNNEESSKGGSAKSDVTVPVQSNNYNYHNADVAKNQVAELTSTEADQDLDMREAFETGFIHPSAGSSPTIAEASPKEAESILAPAPVPPELGSEADNYTTSLNSDGITSNTIAPIVYNTSVDINQVEEVISNKIDLLEAQSNMLSPIHSQLQSEVYSWGMYYQYGMNGPDPTVSGFWDLGHNNGSCGGSDANAQFEQEYQGFVWLEEITNPKVSSSV